MEFVQIKGKAGRPKKISCPTEISHGYSSKLTGLFVLWSKKLITQDEFIVGCCYEELNRDSNANMHFISKPTRSIITSMYSSCAPSICSKITELKLNLSAINQIRALDKILEQAHVDILTVMHQLLLDDPLDTAHFAANLSPVKLRIFKLGLTICSKYFAQNQSTAYSYLKVA